MNQEKKEKQLMNETRNEPKLLKILDGTARYIKK